MTHVNYWSVKDGKRLRFPTVPADVLTAVVEAYIAQGYIFIRQEFDYDNNENTFYVGKSIRPDEVAQQHPYRPDCGRFMVNGKPVNEDEGRGTE